MQVSIKPILTPNVNKTAVYQNFLTNCGKISFQSSRYVSSPDNDCFIKSYDNKTKETSFGDQNIYEGMFPDLNPESRNLLNENSYEIALKNVDIPISSKDEYMGVLERIKNHKSISGRDRYSILFSHNLQNGYKNASEDELGLLPYVGELDCSSHINEFLSGRMRNLGKLTRHIASGRKVSGKLANQLDYLPENYGVMEDIVRVLDYSLDILDKKYGKYKGIVYRQGHMDTGCGQYFSTSRNPKVVAQRINYCTDEDAITEEYSIIRTKNGHKIVNFQRDMGSRFEDEYEILLDRKSKYRRVPIEKCDKILLKARERLADNLYNERCNMYYAKQYTREEFLDIIKVYEEI